MCAWCQKVGVKRYSLSMGSELKSFCSEKCFAACRRAYFKRNKVKLLPYYQLDTLIWHLLETLQIQYTTDLLATTCDKETNLYILITCVSVKSMVTMRLMIVENSLNWTWCYCQSEKFQTFRGIVWLGNTHSTCLLYFPRVRWREWSHSDVCLLSTQLQLGCD